MELARIVADIRGGELELQFHLCRIDEMAAHGTQFAGPASTPGSLGLNAREDFSVQCSKRPLTQIQYVMAVEHGIPR